MLRDVRLRLRSAALALCLVLVGCGDDKEQHTPERRELDVSDAPAMLEQDFRRAFEGSYRVAYELELATELGAKHCTVEWWKEGTERQRFDMCAPLVYGGDFDGEPWRILMSGERGNTLVCSSQLSVDLSAPEYYTGGDGACHEDSSGIGDLAGNAVYYLDFFLEYPDELPDDYFEGIDEIPINRVWQETIAGHEATCYEALRDAPDGSTSTPLSFCYAANGALLYRSAQGWAFEYTLRATDVGDVEAADFEPPYPYVDASVLN
jgi:hypothetical protein